MQQKISPKGFTYVMVLLAVVALVMLAFGGWYVWHKNHTPASKPSSQASQQTQINTRQNQNQVDPSEGGKYLVVTEWNIRIPLTDALRGDAYYVIKKHVDLNDSGSGESIYGDVAYFSSHTISAHANNTCTPVAGAQGDVTGAGPVAITQSDERHVPSSDNDRQVNGKWYSVIKGNGGLCYTGSTGADEDSLITAIVQGTKQIQIVQ